ncbi:MAG: hypothetical protein Q4F85_14470 [Prevotella sp.]|nr:hypothetical protein [Prevotella sp.]
MADILVTLLVFKFSRPIISLRTSQSLNQYAVEVGRADEKDVSKTTFDILGWHLYPAFILYIYPFRSSYKLS